MLLLVTSLSYPSTLPFLWLIAGMTRTALKGRQEHTAMVTVGLVLWHLCWNKGREGMLYGPRGRPCCARLCTLFPAIKPMPHTLLTTHGDLRPWSSFCVFKA